MNRKSANTCLTDMINISIESFKLLLNEINQIENKNSFIIIREDALLSKGESNEETASQDHHLILHLCDTDTENTSLLVNNSNISLLFSPGHIHGNYFCWGFMASFIACIWSRTIQLRWRLSAAGPSSCSWQSRHGLVLFPPAQQFFSSLIDGCLKYKHKEKPKTGPRPGPRLNYDVKIGPIEARSGPGWNAGL